MLGQAEFQVSDTIVATASVSAGVQIGGCHPIRLVISAGWDTAVITLQESFDGVTWFDLLDNNGSEVTLQVVAGKSIVVPPTLLPGVQNLRIRSGTAAVPVAQSADRALIWLTKKYGGTN